MEDILIIDNFYENPEGVRANALDPMGWQPFVSNAEGEIGKFKISKLTNQVAKGRLEEILNRPIELKDAYLRCTMKGIRQIHVHKDSDTINAIVFLTLPEHCQGGLGIYKHKYSDERWVQRVHKFNPNVWELVDKVDMKFNRCVIIDGDILHSRMSSFGDNMNNARLTHNLWIKK